LSNKVHPVFEVTYREDRGRAGDGGYAEFGKVVDKNTGTDLLPGMTLAKLEQYDVSTFSLAFVAYPQQMVIAIKHSDGAAYKLDFSEFQAHPAEQASLLHLKWYGGDAVTWDRPFYRDYVWQENGGYQPKFTTLPVDWDINNPGDCKVKFIDKNNFDLLAPYLEELRETRDTNMFALPPDKFFEIRKQKSFSTFVTEGEKWVKIDILPQKFVFWLPAAEYDKL
jgi:hypothetical protein